MAEVPSSLADILRRAVDAPRNLSPCELAFLLSRETPAELDAIFAAAYALSSALGMVGAFAMVAGFYLLVLVLLIMFRKQWIERPVVKFLASLLIE